MWLAQSHTAKYRGDNIRTQDSLTLTIMLPVLSLCDSNVFESTIFETESEKDMLMNLHFR